MITLEKVFEKILYSSLAATVIVILVLFLKKIFKEKFTPRFYHIIWLLVLTRLLIPFAPESNLSLFNFLPNHNQSLSLEMIIPKFEESMPLVSRESTENTIQPKPTDDVKQKNYKKQISQDKLKSEESIKDKNTNIFQGNLKLLSYIWAIGVLLISLFILTATFKFRKNVKSFDKIKCPEMIHILHKCKEKLKLNRPIELYCDNDFESPFIFGILNPGIYIPKHILTKVDDKELAHILLHELSHYMRGDLLCNLLSTIAVILHWFNPVIWFAMKRMRSDIECACDSYVLENLEDSDSVNYGMTIIKLSSFISKSDHNKMLYAHFYESKDKIERRIVLIKRFKKGTYRLSAVAMILFIALGCFTLTNARANTDAVTALEQEGTVKEEQFNLEGEEPQKVFTTLDRAMDFIDFKFKVPDKIPADYKFSKIFLDEEKGMVSVDFDKTDDMKQICVSMLTSNNDMIKSLKEMHSKNADEKVINKRTIKPDIKFSEEPMSISDIKGTSLTVSKDWNITKEDLAEYKKHDTKQIRVRPMTKVVEKYFVWKDDNIWYSISYYYGSGDFEGFSQSEIPRDDIKILTSSLKYPKDIQNIEYKSKDYNRFLKIYGNKDLKTAKEILGFEPKFPLNLPSGFIPVSSVIYPSDSVLHDGKLIDMIRMNTIFQLKDKDSIQELWLYQTKNTSKYDDMVQNGHINWEHYEDPVDAKVKTNVGEKEIDVLPIMIDGIKVLKYELDITNTNIIAKGITKSQYYTWKQNDVVYEASFIGDMGNQEKIVKALINTP